MAKKIIGKIIDGLLPPKKISIDERTLRNAGVGVLILDERWDRLFTSIEKTPPIIKAEGAIRACLDEKTRLHMENNMNQAERQVKLNRIAELADIIANGGNESALSELEECEARARELGERELLIEQKGYELDAEIKKGNIALLEIAIAYLYRSMKKSQTRVAELDTQIEGMRNTLKNSIDERATLGESINDTYNFLHGLLGAKQIESIDIHYTLD
ncbi:MAG: hypothetical protein FWH01_02415 [Oscillospiraceae bacterium]|nr:hypothetical protein [Oscillospiraceae bacterium]